MVKIAGSKKLKRQMAPLFWGITRKDKRFVVTARPGPHGKNSSIPSAVFLRDMIKIVNNLREAKFAIYNGKVMVDGVKRKSLHHGIGLMDVMNIIPKIIDNYILFIAQSYIKIFKTKFGIMFYDMKQHRFFVYSYHWFWDCSCIIRNPSTFATC